MPLAVEKLCKSYGGKTVLRNVTHTFPERGTAMIGGPSGCGKTTLMRILLGLEQPDSGRIHGKEGAFACAVFQEDRLIAHMTAAGNIALACPRCSREEIHAALAGLGLDPSSEKSVRAYSGGMQRRVAIARAVLAQPDILFLDEPFTGLDDAARENAAAFIRERMQGGLIVVITHDAGEARLLGCSDTLLLTPQNA